MSAETKIVKSFYADITEKKEFSFIRHREMCIITRDSKFGVAEKNENGTLDVLIDCRYDYIDTFCSEKGFTNANTVSTDGKYGLYAFSYSTESDKTVCKLVVSCEYKNIYTLIGSIIIILETSNGLLRYYNMLSGKLSPFYTSVSCDETGCLYCFSDNEVHKWIDTLTDNITYECTETDFISAEKVWKDFYVFSCYCCLDSFVEHVETDLVFCDDSCITSYVIKDITDLQITKYDYDRQGINIIVNFSKNAKRYVVATKDSRWDFDEITKILEESL